ncbi:MAG: hypothetical protein M1821_006128 [Bathelium mastoideum]|nr:MAG: hypothetical protein M1821_006128 [Bathelium mastoideum]
MALERAKEVMNGFAKSAGAANDVSRATSPGGDWHEANGSANGIGDTEELGRYRPRTFPYQEYLPYTTEPDDAKRRNLAECIEELYIAVSAGDFAPGAEHWTREIRGWISLKYDMTRPQRVRLVKLYYELSLAPGLDFSVAERFASMFMVLTKRKHYLRPGKDLILDWRPLYKELKAFVMPNESATQNTGMVKRNVRTLTKMCTFAQLYFDPKDVHAMLEEMLPYFSTSFTEGAYVVAGLLNLLLPTMPGPPDDPTLQPQHFLPTLFHIWSLVNRSRVFDVHFIDMLSRFARDSLPAEHIPWSEYGMFTAEQTELVFTAILRLLEIPVGQSTSPYSSTVDVTAGSALYLERDQRKHPTAHSIARWIIMSLSPASLSEPDSMLTKLEGLVQAIETFFHPSNSGSWTKTLSQLTFYLADFFVMRWNRERNGEMDVPPERRLNDAIKKRFVLCLRDVIFMGIFAKSGTAMTFSLSTLQSLAYLEPQLILPGALQRIYPAMQGLVEVHRTISSIRSLAMLSKTMSRTKGFRCHITTLLGLALPGIDANDLDKTLNTLAFIQAVCYNIPIYNLTKENKTVVINGTANTNGDETMGGEGSDVGDEAAGTARAVQWITEQVDRFERDGTGIEIDYENELSDKEEEAILASSTAGFNEFIISFLGRVFTLLDNLPDASRVRSGSPEENIVNSLPATFTPLLAALSPELYDTALNKIASFVLNHVINQARDAVAFICNAVVKINPKKALVRLLPDLITGIRTEIEDNGAGSSRTTGSEVLPRDRALVWDISLLSMCVVHIGDAVLDYKDQLLDIAIYMQKHCKGIPTVHVSNFIHHLLLDLTGIYPVDYSLYEKQDLERGLSPKDWGRSTDPKSLNIQWHVPSPAELTFAYELFESQAQHAIEALTALTGDNPPIKRDGTGKDWSDEVSRNLTLFRLIVSGVSVLFDVRHPSISPQLGSKSEDSELNASKDDEALYEEQLWHTFRCNSGYPLQSPNSKYDSNGHDQLHKTRTAVGETLHRVHQFLTEKQEDDVQCFSALYITYRSWFVDVGIERSAHVLDRVHRLLTSDTHPFKFSGARKEYPRPILVRRAGVYHLQRLRYNSSPRKATELDKTLLLDLAQSSMSVYTEVRRTAQSASESAVKSVIGGRTLVIPSLLRAFEVAVKETDFPRIKAALFSLLFGSLAKTIARNWKFAPSLIKTFIEVTGADKPSIQKLAQNATFQIVDMSRPQERMVILDQKVVNDLLSFFVNLDGRSNSSWEEHADKVIEARRAKVQRKRKLAEREKADLAMDLLEVTRNSHWKKAARTAGIAITLDVRFDHISSKGMLDLVTMGTIDPHPNLRALYANSLAATFALIQSRACVKHDYKNYLLDVDHTPDIIQIPTDRSDPDWTKKFLAGFAQPEAKYYVDHDYPGWLVWGKTFRAYETDPTLLDYDDVEQDVRRHIGKMMNRHWFSTYFGFMKQEPRDQGADRFRITSTVILSYAFDLVFEGLSAANWEDIKDLVRAVYGDGSDKHQHRATAEIMAALLSVATDLKVDQRTMIWEFVFDIVQSVFSDGLTPENEPYWSSFVHVVFSGRDPRRNWPLLDWLSGFRLDMSSNAAFKESSKIHLLQVCVLTIGWHFQLDKPITENFLQHLDHPYKGVREAMGTTLATINRTRHHESFLDVPDLVLAQKKSSSIGVRPYQPSEEFSTIIRDVFERLEVWRQARPPGQQTPSSYTSGSKTVLLWLDTILASHECTQLVRFFPDVFMEQLLHMMDIKEDPELQSLAYHVFRHLPNIPHRAGEDEEFVQALIRIGRTSTSWHQRLRILINIQVVYFRRLFLMSRQQQQALFTCVADMLADTQLEVRLGASATLSGMIRCSPTPLRDQVVQDLNRDFTTMLEDNPLPPRRKAKPASTSGSGTNPGTPTPEQNRLILTRHAAVLGLGSLVSAFPYTSPPPAWLPGVLATLAARASADPGMVGKSVKTILADFKKTRQDTWHVDVKAFEPEQLENLEGVLWKSYFA